MRELHVYGTAVPVHGRDPTKFQHQGFGTLLMEEAERIAREEHGSVKLAVISGMSSYTRLVTSRSPPQTLIGMESGCRCRNSRLLSTAWVRARWTVYEQVAAVVVVSKVGLVSSDVSPMHVVLVLCIILESDFVYNGMCTIKAGPKYIGNP